MDKDKKILGIIGGMGPLATADLFRKIVVNTKADTDREHIRILIDNNTNIPDRTEAIINNGISPVSQLAESAVSLQNMGAQLLVMPCNTAHYFHSDVQKNVDIPVLNMIEITAKALRDRKIKKAGLLATEGTVRSRIYQRELEKSGIDIILPSKDEQIVVTELIYNGVKAGKKDYNTDEARKVIEKIIANGAETLILGCTELPVAKDMYRLDYNTCDPTLELARAAIEASGYECI